MAQKSITRFLRHSVDYRVILLDLDTTPWRTNRVIDFCAMVLLSNIYVINDGARVLKSSHDS